MMVKTYKSIFILLSWKIAPSGDLLFICSNQPYKVKEDMVREKIFKLIEEFPDYLVLSRSFNQVNEIMQLEKEVPLNTDDKPYLEFASIQNLMMSTFVLL